MGLILINLPLVTCQEDSNERLRYIAFIRKCIWKDRPEEIVQTQRNMRLIRVYTVCRKFISFKTFRSQTRLDVRKRIFWHMSQTNTKIACTSVQSNRIFVVRLKTLYILGYSKCAQWRFWSDCAVWSESSLAIYTQRYVLWRRSVNRFVQSLGQLRKWVNGRFLWINKKICQYLLSSRQILLEILPGVW